MTAIEAEKNYIVGELQGIIAQESLKPQSPQDPLTRAVANLEALNSWVIADKDEQNEVIPSPLGGYLLSKDVVIPLAYPLYQRIGDLIWNMGTIPTGPHYVFTGIGVRYVKYGLVADHCLMTSERMEGLWENNRRVVNGFASIDREKFAQSLLRKVQHSFPLRSPVVITTKSL